MTIPTDLSVDEITTSLNTLVIEKDKDGKFICGIENCIKSFKNKGHLNVHKANIHNINVVYHICDYKNCSSKFKQAAELKKHKRNVHLIDTLYYNCTYENCTIKCNQKCNLEKHINDVHLNAKLFKCLEIGCVSKFKRKEHLQIHHEAIHDNTNIKWFSCNENKCIFKCKQKGHLNIHMSDMHDINTILKKCDIINCGYSTKQTSNLNSHKDIMHDIGTNNCNICFTDKKSTNKYKDINNIVINICNACFKKMTGKESRSEVKMSNYLDTIIEIKPYLIGTDNTFISMGGCSLKRPDKLYNSDIVLWVECDEYQHTRHNGSYTCDEKRISDAYDEFEGKHLVVIRWNPNKYISKTGQILSLDNRLIELKKLILNILKNPPKDIIYIYYMYYNVDNELLPENFNYEIIH